MSSYEVKTQLVLDSAKAVRGIANMRRALASLTKQIGATQSKFNKLGPRRGGRGGGAGGAGVGGDGGGGISRGIGNYMLAGAGIGLMSSAVGVIKNQVSAASDFRKEMENGKFAVASLYVAVDKMPLANALVKAKDKMIDFNAMAAQAPGGAQDMLAIYQRIYGSMRRSGLAAKDIEKATIATAVAGKAMDIQSIAALGRDVQEMLSGTAGMAKTRLFANAKSAGLITMDTKEFNALSQEERLKEVLSLLSKFGPMGEAMSKSWGGATESFESWFNVLRDLAAEGLFDALGKQIYALNTTIRDNLPLLQSYLGAAGASMGATATGIGANASRAAGASAVTGLVGGDSVLAAGGLTALLGSAATLVGAQGILAAGGAAGAGAGASGAMAAGAGAVSMAAMGEALLFLGPLLLGAVAVFQLMTKHAEGFGAFFSVIGGGAAGAVLHTISGVFMTLLAVFKTVVGYVTYWLQPVFMGLFGLFMVGYGIVMTFVEIMRVLFEVFSDVTQAFSGDDLKSAADDMEQFTKNVKSGMASMASWVLTLFADMTLWLARLLDGVPGMFKQSDDLYNMSAGIHAKIPEMLKRVLGDDGAATGKAGDDEHPMNVGAFMEFLNGEFAKLKDASSVGGKKYAPATEINVQRMIINQEFKGNSDPDRVVASFMKRVTDQATRPLTSGVL